MARILIVDDEQSIRETLKEILDYEGYEVEEAADGEKALSLIKKFNYDAVLADIKMPKLDGLELLEKAKEIAPELPIIMISGHGTTETAVEATKKGAFDFINKPPDLNKLLITVRNAVDKNSLVIETKVLKRQITKTREIVGDAPSIKKIKKTIEKVAPTDARVMITGENGTGKELVARWIHERSNRADKPLIEVNCAAIPTELIESELFGHEKGSFTSAHKQKLGKFEKANGGTLFLDEIGDMSLSAQAKVLRALQENKITRVGGEKDINVDVRIVAATNKDLMQEIADGNFREDLYHRISVIVIHVPTLNERVSDIPTLAEKFMEEICEDNGINKKQITAGAMDALKNIYWSGNIRELRNIIERLIILCDNKITEDEVQLYANNGKKRPGTIDAITEFNRFQDFKDYAERMFIDAKLKKNNWNVAKTAAEIDIQRSHLYNKIDKFDLKRDKK
ncbi:sigma-54 dependent transcriptional regulator [Bacteroidia bacterium]|jgi:two-component system nitrogen regulation response regulator NtrX|nr:sigma-54 dependent transcriptional regulator [Bacteroidia bacterium]|tara:strand:+ start:7243 stop:8604 length:1362 start_codon:yes stop_codon:yes gene_type:complete